MIVDFDGDETRLIEQIKSDNLVDENKIDIIPYADFSKAIVGKSIPIYNRDNNKFLH